MGMLDEPQSQRYVPKAPRWRGRTPASEDNFQELQLMGHEGHLSEQQRIDGESE